MSGGKVWHCRTIYNPKMLDTANFQIWIKDTVWTGPHRAGARRMIDCHDRVPDKFIQFSIGFDVWTGGKLATSIRGKRLLVSNIASDF